MSKRILLIGENSVDVTQYGVVKKFAVEAPVPVLTPTRRIINAGCAGNVERNLRSLESDWQIDFIHQEDNHEIIKTRYVDESTGHLIMRMDEADYCSAIDRNVLDKILQDIQARVYDAAIYSSYNKGLLSKSDIAEISYCCRKNAVPDFLDCKYSLDKTWSQNVFMVKINEKEFKEQKEFISYRNVTEFCQNLVYTMGQRGAYLVNKEVLVEGVKISVDNVVGAGDSYLAGIVSGYLNTKDIIKAMEYANLVAAISVSNPGVYAVKKQDIELEEGKLK